jgi:di/tricarboxylate transporter
MLWEAWFTLAVIGMCFALLIIRRTAPDIVFIGGLTLLLLSGVLTPEQALAGLANEGMVAIGMLYIIASGLQETGATQLIMPSLFGRPKSLSHAQLKLMVPVATMSAFMNNTPVVAVLIPAVSDWAKKYQIPVSKLMIPLSYAAIVGGTCTLIGTSTNLIVNGLLISETDYGSLGMFELAWIGLPCAVVVMILVVLFQKWLLPSKQSVMSQLEDARSYIVEMVVEPNSPLVGKTIEDAGLRQLPGMYLMEIERAGRILAAVSPNEFLEGNDRLIFTGVVESVVDLKKVRGLKPATDQIFKLDAPSSERALAEAVVSDSCPLIGKSIREGRFRTTYNAVVIAVARNGEQVRQKMGDIVLRPGDTLLLETHPSFTNQQRNSRDFFLVSQLENSTPPRHERALLALAILAGMVVSVTVGWLSILEGAMLAAACMVLTRCTSGSLARRNVNWQVLLVIAASFGIGQAMLVSGAAGNIAQLLVSFTAGSPTLALGTIFFITAVFTAIITNNAAAVLMFPIAIEMAHSLGISIMPLIITIMIAASASFATPIGYQTNLMVYGPGGYQFSDYLRIGIPLTIVVGVITVFLSPLLWPF